MPYYDKSPGRGRDIAETPSIANQLDLDGWTIVDAHDCDPSSVQPRIIIHGGAGNIKRDKLPESSYKMYQEALLSILSHCGKLLEDPKATALDVAAHAVSMLEDNPLFNAGKGAVFTRAGENELEASIMITDGYQKRGVGCMMLKHVKNPIKLAREMMIRGNLPNGGGAQGHSQLSGPYLEGLAKAWELELVDPSYFFTQRRWDEHRRGLQSESARDEDLSRDFYPPAEVPYSKDPSWNGKEYLPQGTVGAVVLDRFGTICVATSTGGLTNKLPGRIGDTPTLGAGFWAEEWHRIVTKELKGEYETRVRHAVAMSGTGNGDSFLRTNACRTAAAISRFSIPGTSLADSITQVAGPGGELQKSAGDRWQRTGEGEGGIIGISLVGSKSKVCYDFNCGGMFTAWIDDHGKHCFSVFRDED